MIETIINDNILDQKRERRHFQEREIIIIIDPGNIIMTKIEINKI